MKAGAHIIQRQSIDIQFENMENDNGLQNRLADLFYDRLEPGMEQLLDELFGEKYYASVEKLEIECEVLNEKDWEEGLAEQIIQKLREKLSPVNKREIKDAKVEELTAPEIFLFFLENGSFPWNNRVNSINELEQLISVNNELLAKLTEKIKEYPKIAERLALQFSEKFTSTVITELTKERQWERSELNSRISKLDSTLNRQAVDGAILKMLASDHHDNPTEQLLEKLVDKALAKNKAIDEKIDKTIDKNINKKEDNNCYITNAGLILLHPFLSILFEQLKLIHENEWIDELAQTKAVLVLDYLVTGNEKAAEFNLMLNKILCGFAINNIIRTDVALDHEAKNECETLLKNVIVHWSALKNTGIDALRETFLQRNGKLSPVDNGWLLTVEQKSTDILLGYLPWGFGVIRLPWMKEIVHTDWC
ncbi:contractile injection system tape measure protein [Solitalea canadensis]|uniref:Uncharacterized protein n=1 Tax=Solitalea canadensis (strain ATCC 29591 / DSM 3403 / JCM 21819 / LMG 8368 / NBRC 15130 / NCIMB 12057 / USAM 9D) TaxID=929556 RepID=H8KU88_SOLCM|nr:contractile injection system tape measure protein [Solitalea canadensis]AFD07200.1 hypothetical protein Solca_2147 [Solitalea canadensis DSM 3403]